MPRARSKILIIDDEPDACILFEKIVGHLGHTIFSAVDASTGIALYKKEMPDLVFLDIVMPEMDGITLLKKIRRLNPEQRVIIITGHGDLRSAREAMKSGAYDYVSKPLNLKALKSSISDALA